MAKKKDDPNDLGDLDGFFKMGAHNEGTGNVPTGHFKLDFAIQYGEDATKADLNKVEGYDPGKTLGIPLGPLVEFFGEEGSGKSSLAYRIAGYAQKLGHKVAWIDVEHSYKEALAKLNGCDIDKMLYSNMINTKDPDKPIYGENVFGFMIKAMEHDVKVIVLDSVANLIPKALYEANDEQQFMGLLARMLSQNLGKLVAHAEKHGCLVIFINQLRKNLSIGQYGDPDTSPGGHSLKHNASLRLKITKKTGKDANIFMADPHDEFNDPILMGRFANVKIMKNRFAKPYLGSIEVPIYYQAYFPEIEDIAFDTGRQIKLISVRNKVYKWEDIRIEGRKGFIDHIVENKLVDALVVAIKAKAEVDGVLLPPEINLYKPTSVGVKDGKNTGHISGDVKKKNSPSSEGVPKKTKRKKSS
jgi:recombination protein RecA